MTGKVVQLNQSDALQGEAVQDVVAELESLLALAKSGNIRAVAYAIVKADGGTFGTGWTGAAGTNKTLCAAANVMAHRITAKLAVNYD